MHGVCAHPSSDIHSITERSDVLGKLCTVTLLIAFPVSSFGIWRNIPVMRICSHQNTRCPTKESFWTVNNGRLCAERKDVGSMTYTVL